MHIGIVFSGAKKDTKGCPVKFGCLRSHKKRCPCGALLSRQSPRFERVTRAAIFVPVPPPRSNKAKLIDFSRQRSKPFLPWLLLQNAKGSNKTELFCDEVAQFGIVRQTANSNRSKLSPCKRQSLFSAQRSTITRLFVVQQERA